MIGAPRMALEVAFGALLSGGLLALSTVLAIRHRSSAAGFAWTVVAGVSAGLLAMSAALHLPATDGTRAAAVQLSAVLLAAALGASSFPARRQGASQSRSLPVGRTVAWLTLLGLPPTLGFHGKVMVYRALLAAGWHWAAALAMAANVIWLVPALWALGAPSHGSAGAWRTAAAVVLIAALLALGVYPQPALDLAGHFERLLAAG